MDGTDHLLTPAEVAARLRVDRRTVARWAYEGRPPFIRVGMRGHRRYPAAAVAALIDRTGLDNPPPRPRRDSPAPEPKPPPVPVDETAAPPLSEVGFAAALGARLRAARLAKGWTLRQAAAATGNTIKPVPLRSYETGERGLTVNRFAQLLATYETTAADLLPDTEPPVVDMGPITLQVDRLHELPPILYGPISRYVATVLAARNTRTARQVTIRRSDLFVLASVLATTPDGLVSQLDRWGVLAPPPATSPGD